MKLYLFIRSKTFFQRLDQVGTCCSCHYLIDIISDWAVNALQVYKDSNQVILLKLQGMVFTVFTEDNIYE